MLRITKINILFFSLLIGGIVYRIFLGSFAEHQLVWDMAVYDRLGRSVAEGKLTADCCLHGIGYPLFLAIIYRIFSGDTLQNVRYVQAVLDTSTAILIYLTAQKFLNSRSAWWAFLLYLINPLPAAFTGLILTETVVLWCVAVIMYLLVLLASSSWVLAFLGMSIGLLMITKLSFYVFGFWLIALILYLSFQYGYMKRFLLYFLPGFFLLMLYPLVANYRLYETVSVKPPYHTPYGLLYIYSEVYPDRYPELTVDFQQPLHPVFVRVMDEFYAYQQNNPAGLSLYEQKYRALFWSNMPARMPVLFTNMVLNMVRIWDKRFVFTYTDPFYPAHTVAIRAITVLFVGTSFLGLVFFLKKKGSSLVQPITMYTFSLFFYICFVFSLVSNETRHALPFYPIASVWAGYGSISIAGYFRRLFHI